MTPAATVESRVNRTVIRLKKGDLTALPVDALVFYAREDLQLGSGFGTALQVRGGDAIRKELEKIGSIRTGEAVLTTAGKLKANYLIHACGPKFQEPETESKLDAAMRAALAAADKKGVKSIAFPPMGAGFYGVPLDTCARVMTESLRAFLAGPCSLEEVVICVIDNREFQAFEKHVKGA